MDKRRLDKEGPLIASVAGNHAHVLSTHLRPRLGTAAHLSITVVSLWRSSQAALADCYRHIERLQEDCRPDLMRHYEWVADQTWNLFRPFAGDLYRYGVRRR